jgi:hypothetical protein
MFSIMLITLPLDGRLALPLSQALTTSFHYMSSKPCHSSVRVLTLSAVPCAVRGSPSPATLIIKPGVTTSSSGTLSTLHAATCATNHTMPWSKLSGTLQLINSLRGRWSRWMVWLPVSFPKPVLDRCSKIQLYNSLRGIQDINILLRCNTVLPFPAFNVAGCHRRVQPEFNTGVWQLLFSLKPESHLHHPPVVLGQHHQTAAAPSSHSPPIQCV